MIQRRGKELLTILMAGGQGERLYPLTRDRAKPAVPFGGLYRVIDFTLTNCLHSGLRRIEILTQYKSLSLARHLNLAWNKFNFELGEYIHVNPPQLRSRKTWYQGTADAVYQNIYTLERAKPKHVFILSGDHIYKMDYRKMFAFHLKNNADVTVGAIPVPLSEASAFGVIEKDKTGRMVGFQEKPAKPKPAPGNPDQAMVSMGIYIFKADCLVHRLVRDAKKQESQHDFGKNIIPAMVQSMDRVFVYPFQDRGGNAAYWRDIGTLDAYWASHMDLLGEKPVFNLRDKNWPIWTFYQHLPASRIIRGGDIDNALISNGCRLNRAAVRNSILSPGVHVGKNSEVEDSVILNHVRIGSNVRIHKAIIDKGVHVPSGMVIDGRRRTNGAGFKLTPGGITVIPKEEPLQ